MINQNQKAQTLKQTCTACMNISLRFANARVQWFNHAGLFGIQTGSFHIFFDEPLQSILILSFSTEKNNHILSADG